MMSEREKEIAIAKMKAQGCRRWMTILVIAPVFLCAALAILTPTIRTFLAKNEATQQCQTLSEQDEPVIDKRVFTIDDYTSEIVITAETINGMILLGEMTFDDAVSNTTAAIAHPNGDYAIYADSQVSEIRRFFICDSGNQALGAFTGDDQTDITFNADGSIFAVSDSQLGQIRLFDGIEIRELEPIELPKTEDSRQIDSLAFHPTQPLIFVISENDLFVFETNTMVQVFHISIFEAVDSQIGFNADGTLLFLIDADGHQADVWAVRE